MVPDSSSQDLFDFLTAQPVVAAVIVVAVVLAVALSLAGARPPRWLRTRRRLAEMVVATQLEYARQDAESMRWARAVTAGQVAPPWACSECTTRGLCAITGCKRAKAVDA